MNVFRNFAPDFAVIHYMKFITRHTAIAFISLIFGDLVVAGQTPGTTADSVPAVAPAVPADTVPPRKKGLISRIISYFDDSNKPPSHKKFDISFLGGPSYSSSTNFEIAVIAAGLYKSRYDSLTPRSNISIFTEVSVIGMFNVGVRGSHIFPGDHMRINYDGNFTRFPSYFWGIGFDSERNDDNKGKYTLFESAINAEFIWKLGRNVFLGPAFTFNYSQADDVKKPELWRGERLKQLNYGAGIVFSLDTRDDAENPYKGLHFQLSNRYYPTFLGNRRYFYTGEVTLGIYHRFWESGVWALQAHGAISGKDTPWSMLPTIDASGAVRGYYEGRYRDRNEADIVLELRQKVWRRNGIVLWGGVAAVFDHPSEITGRRLLPTYGIGYRWEFKKRVNVRVDFGIGRHSTAFNVSINEAF